ncbi:MAG: aspartate-semialdehyde dehydrogenase, partial [Candidatus Bathyarchaeia archaeon]
MLKAAVLGATGNVGQIFVQLLEGHPWFEVTCVAASERSKGQTYGEASRWRQTTSIPEAVAKMEVVDINPKEVKNVDIVFSALPSDVAGKAEEEFAKAGYV